MNEYSNVNARRYRESTNAIHNTDQYPAYNQYQNMSSQGNLPPPNRVYAQPSYQSSRLANYGNQIMDGNPGNMESTTEYTNEAALSSERKNLRLPANPFVPTDRTSQRDLIVETHQVPGLGRGYNQRDQQLWEKKQRIANDLAQAYQDQMADKKRREYEEKMRRDAEERAIEDKVKRELQEMTRAHHAEKEISRHDLSRINRSFEELKDELELDNEGRRVRKKPNLVNKSGLQSSKRDGDSQDKGDSTYQSHLVNIRDTAVGPIAEQEDEYSKSHILNDSLLDQQKSNSPNRQSQFASRHNKTDSQPIAMELNISFKTVADERMYRLKKEISARTSSLQEQAAALKV